MLLSGALAGGCARQRDAEDQEPVQILFINPWVGHEVWNKVAQGAEDASRDLGVELTMVGAPEGYSEATIMLSHLETAIAQRYDGVLCHPFIPDTFTPLIDRAELADVRIVCVADDAPQSKRSAAILTDDLAAGRAAARCVLQALHGQAPVIGCLSATPGVPALDARLKGFLEIIEEVPNAKVVGTEYGYSDYLKNISKIQAQLTANPDVNVLFGTGGDHPSSHGRVVKEMGKDGKILIVGFDDMQETLDLIDEGTVHAAVVQGLHKWGYLGVKYLHALSQGNEVPKVTHADIVVVTKENLDSFRDD